MIKLSSNVYPTRLFLNSNDCIEIKGGVNKWGSSLKLKLREVAKKNPLYGKKIDCNVSGQDENGGDIQINSVGKWTFGVPGYMGHIRCQQNEQVIVQLPKGCPPEVVELITWAVEKLKEK